MLKGCLLSTVMAAGLLVGVAHAQDQQPDAAASFVAPDAYSPQWSDSGIAKAAKQLTGTWRSTESVGDSAVWMTVAPAPVEGMSDTLYVESVRAATPWEPYRRAMFQLYRYKGEIRLRTYDFAVGSASEGVFDGMWGATEYFPQVSADDLVATLDVEIEPSANGFTGATPYPYPTGVAGAVEMTSSVTLDGDTLTVADRGYNDKGEVVWGADANSAVRFKRGQAYAQVDRREDGMIIVNYPSALADALVPQDGDELHVHYNGYLGDASRFDSSYARNLPFVFTYPPGTRAITGWGIGMDGFAMGAHRKLIIPGYLAYGERGNPRANIPGDATLYFNVFMAHIERPQAQESGHDDHGHDAHDGHDHGDHSHED